MRTFVLSLCIYLLSGWPFSLGGLHIFSRRNRGGVDLMELGGMRRVGGMEGEEIVIRIYCMTGESTFNKKVFYSYK